MVIQSDSSDSEEYAKLTNNRSLIFEFNVDLSKDKVVLQKKQLRSKNEKSRSSFSKTPKAPWPPSLDMRSLSPPSDYDSDVENYSKFMKSNRKEYILEDYELFKVIIDYEKLLINSNIFPKKGVGSILKIPEIGKTLSLKELEIIVRRVWDSIPATK